jgi:hypothetical protein
MNTKYTKEILKRAIEKNTSWNGVCISLNLKPKGGSQTHLKKRALDFGIDFSHFPGSAHNKGKSLDYLMITAEEYIKNSKVILSDRLKKKLFRECLKEERCERCKLNKWLGEELPLELDHINGDHADNRIENLQILCPNCHSVKTRKDRKKSAHG